MACVDMVRHGAFLFTPYLFLYFMIELLDSWLAYKGPYNLIYVLYDETHNDVIIVMCLD